MKDMKIQATNHAPEKNHLVQRDKDLKKACQEFEAVFMYQVLRTMRKTIDKSDLLHGGQGEEIYESMLDQELSKTMGGQGKNSLARLLYQQLRQRDGQAVTESDNDQPIWPLKTRLSSRFGWRKDPITGEEKFHHGIDLAAKEGTPVNAALSGKVSFAGYKQKYGHVVELDHGNGLKTLYAHNRKNLVKQGEWVRTGTPIAQVGSTGRSTGPHLHFEIKQDGQAVDPLMMLGA